MALVDNGFKLIVKSQEQTPLLMPMNGAVTGGISPMQRDGIGSTKNFLSLCWPKTIKTAGEPIKNT